MYFKENMPIPLCLLFGWISTFSLLCKFATVNSEDNRTNLAAVIPGDIILGGLFPIYTTIKTQCDEINPERGIQRMEAMMFTIDEINSRPDILPSIVLGARILDTCSKETYALEQALEFVKASLSDSESADSSYYCDGGGTLKRKNRSVQPIRGVVGSAYSSVSIQVANLLRLFTIPMISYASSSARLSEKQNHPLFARTLPSDKTQARAMAALVAYFNWTFVSTVRSSGDYGDSGIDAFWKEGEKLGVCIAAREVIKQRMSIAEIDHIVKVLYYDFFKARVVVLFTRLDHTKLLLEAVRRANISGHFVWIAADGWGRETVAIDSTNSSNKHVVTGALTFESKTKEITQFTQYFKQLSLETNMRNPWFADYWKKLFHCAQTDPEHKGTKSCPVGHLGQHRADFQQEAKIQFVYDAVYAFAWGLEAIRKQQCVPPITHERCIQKINQYNGKKFYDLIITSKFTDDYGNNVRFDKNGDGLGHYNIYNYVWKPELGTHDYVPVGEFRNGNLQINDLIIWPNNAQQNPKSTCSEPCKSGQIKKFNKKDQKCCWICDNCKRNEFMKNESHCEACKEGWWPKEDKMSCYTLEIHYMRLRSWFAIGPMFLSGLGILATSFVILTFMRYNETPVVRASGRELSYLLLSGCLICYLMSFILLLKPSGVTCAFQRFGIGFGFAVIYSSLLTKTNRISRIFASANQSAKRPPFISPKSQLLISGLLIGMQILCTAIWVTLSPPGTRLDTTEESFPILRCKIDDRSFLVSLVYNMLLICVCTVYAIKTRRIPENFNESKFIGFTMYTTCIIWLAFVPIYFGTLHTFEVQITTLCISISLSATVTLVCLFAPKLYIIFLQPEKNVRKLTMNSTYKKPNSSGSIINHRDNREALEYCPLPNSTMCELVETQCVEEEIGNSPRSPPPYPALQYPPDNNVIVNQREIDNNSITSL